MSRLRYFFLKNFKELDIRFHTHTHAHTQTHPTWAKVNDV